MKQMTQWIAVALIIMLGFPGSATAVESGVRDAIVKIYTISDAPDYYNPWSMHGPRGSTGSGCIIKGKKILTNGHVVGNETFIQVRRHGESKKYRARVLSVSHEADLALLSVDDPEFFEGVTPLEFGTLPETQEEVLVYGFPLGGDVMSITKGVISRIEHRTYAHSSCYFLAGQIDAAINPGNSGGPVVIDGKIVGVVMQGMSSADNIGYMVPIPVIQHFLDDIEDENYDGYPSLGIIMQNMESPVLKKQYNMAEDETGMLINRIVPGSPAEGIIKPGDVLLSVGGHDVADDGTVEFRPKERTSVAYYIQEKQVGEKLNIGLMRNGEILNEEVTLHRSLVEDWLIPNEEFDILPTYYIYGGVVFCPVTKNLLQAWGSKWYNNAPKELVAMLSNNYVTEDRDEVVLLLKVLAADVNEGYHGHANWIVTEVNGRKIRNLKELIEIVESGPAGMFVEFSNDKDEKVVLDRKAVEALKEDILGIYRIEFDRSVDLR